jgi:hypothetical protein
MQFWVKVKGRINTNLSRNTPFSPDTSSHQISTKNLQSLRNYTAEGKYTDGRRNSIFKMAAWSNREKVSSHQISVK